MEARLHVTFEAAPNIVVEPMTAMHHFYGYH